tara:strand:+ start:333 stop:548 length:216 start_codon:yes stop_codon:yes gene_type:complete
MKDYDGYLNRQAEVLQEFDDFCEQFEKRAAEQFKDADKSDERFKLLREITNESGGDASTLLEGDPGLEERG